MANSLNFDNRLHNSVLKVAFQEQHEQIANTLNVTSIVGMLFAKKVLSADDVMELNLIKHRIDRCRNLLLLLHKSSSSDAFVHLHQAISEEPTYDFLVQELDEKCDRIFKEMTSATSDDSVAGDDSVDSNDNSATAKESINDIKCINVIAVSRESRVAAARNVQISDRMMSFRNELKRLEDDKDKFLVTIQSVEEAIKVKAEELKQLVDTRVAELAIELQSFQAKTCMEIAKRIDKLRAIIGEMEAFEEQCTTELASGTGSSSSSHKLLIASQKLLETNVPCDDYRTPDIVFVPDEPCACEKTVLGKILAVSLHRSIAKLNQPIWGLALLDEDLYVARCPPAHIVVYDKAHSPVQRHITISNDVKDVHRMDIAACKRNMCIYVAHTSSKESAVHRINKSGKPICKWSMSDEPHGLSVSSSSNLVVACYVVAKIKEYTAVGDLVREINLQTDVVHPLHAVQLSRDRFLVGHGHQGDTLHRICIVDSSGSVLRSYGGKRGQEPGHLFTPVRLAVNCGGLVVAADINNSRVLMMNKRLQYVHEIKSIWRGPRRIAFDEQTGLLYVAINEYVPDVDIGGHVDIYKIVNL